MRRKLVRLARMDGRELSWRGRTAVRSLLQRTACALRPPEWRRGDLLAALASDRALDDVRKALRAGAWPDAHQGLSEHLLRRPSQFLLAPAERTATVERIRRRFPSAVADAVDRGGALLRGTYNLLGYRGLTFQRGCSLTDTGALDLPDPRKCVDFVGQSTTGPDWHYDPVHHRRAPRTFWASVPYLNPSCGDHKIIWELNRHQHWLVLGRAFWLSGDPVYRDRCLLELTSWLDANPPLVGINWASMLELGFRSLSWIWALHFFAGSDQDAPNATAWTVDMLAALDRQLTHVEQNLSYYFSPNTHLLGEALALYVAGQSLPELAASARRAAVGRRILVTEIARQIAPDGGHCERSTHYHRYTLDFYLMALAIARITRDPIAAVFERAVVRLASAARALCDDTGRAVHIGDDDGGMLLAIAGRPADDWRDSLFIAAILTARPDLAPGSPPEEAFWMLAHPVLAEGLEPRQRARRVPRTNPIGSAALPVTGYYVSRSGAGEHIVVDGGPHGYRTAGHSHADALSLTMSIHGLRLLIDPGTACYTIDAVLRDRFRSTALHNTVVVDGRPQSIPSAPFQWARTVDAIAHRWRSTHAFDYFDGSHDGYAPVVHRRRALMMHGDAVVVADHIDDSTRAPRTASAHWHVHPGWEVEAAGRRVRFRSRRDQVSLIVPHGRVEMFVADNQTGLGWHSPDYGRVEQATTVRITCNAPAPFWMVSVFDLNPIDPIQDVAVLPVWAEAGTVAHAIGLRLARHASTDFVLFVEPGETGSRVTWRIAEFETDARVLFCSVGPEGDLTRLALVDGSTVRGTGRRAMGFTLGQIAPAVYIDGSTIRQYTPCAASPGS